MTPGHARAAGPGVLVLVFVLLSGCAPVAPGPKSAALVADFSSSEQPVQSHDRAGANGFVVAEVRGSAIAVYPSPGASSPALSLANPTEEGAPRVFLALQGTAGWLRVFLPVRPNDTTGWIRVADVVLKTNPYGIRVELGKHRLSVWRGRELVLREDAGVGRSVTGTPKGVYYLTELLRAPDPKGPYGPYAFGTSAFSNVLTDFEGGNGVIGIHGTNDPGGIGKDVSHGCIRLANDAISRLADMLPLGTPVFITP